MLYAVKLVAVYAFKRVYGCGAHLRPVALGEQLYALRRRIGALVILTGQIFHRKRICQFGQSVAYRIAVGFGEHYAPCALKLVALNALYIVALKYSYASQVVKTQRKAQVAFEVLRLYIKSRLLFNVYPRNTVHITRSLKFRSPRGYST